MASYRAPGVYIEEKQTGPRSIQGVGTSTAGFLGQAERGPVRPQFLTSFADYERTFGEYDLYRQGERLVGTYLAYAVQGFFDNGGSQCFVGRVEAEAMPTASAPLGGEVIEPEPEPESRLVADPEVVAFPITPVGLTRDGEVTIRNASEEQVVIQGVKVEGGVPFEVTKLVERDGTNKTEIDLSAQDAFPHVLPPATEPDGPELIVTVEFTAADKDTPNKEGTLTVHRLNEPEELIELTGSVTAAQQDTLGTVPESLSPEIIPIGRSMTEQVTLFNSGATKDITITAIEDPSNSFPEGASVEFELHDEDGASVDLSDLTGLTHTLAPGELATLTARFAFDDPNTLDSTGNEDPIRITYDTVDPNNQTKTKEISYAVEGGYELNAEALTFGTVVAGRSSERAQILKLTNRRESANLDISDVSVPDDPPFGLTVFNQNGAQVPENSVPSLGPNESVEIHVRFTPQSVGTVEETLTVTLSGGTVKLPLVGVGAPGVMTVEATGPGIWGRNVAVIQRPASDTRDDDLFQLVVRYWTRDEDAEVARANDADPEMDAVPDPSHSEVEFDNLSPDETSPNYYVTRINGSSNLITVRRDVPGGPASLDDDQEQRVTWLDEDFTPPSAGEFDVDIDDYEGGRGPSVDVPTGLAAFEEIDEIAIVSVPDEVTYPDLTTSVVTHCERERRVAVLQADRGFATTDTQKKLPPVDSDYAAFYYPWIQIRDPATNARTLVPPGGQVAGIYARTDAERGVHKAPANEVVRNALGLQVEVTQQEQAILNPKGVNCILRFSGRGFRVWGARTTSSDSLWRYLNVRRLFLYVEKSVERATQYAVFEPNGPVLWGQINQSVTNFLTTVWRSGALMGATADEAFSVRCDRTTMTQDDIDNGRLIVEIGIAPVNPAEFVVFRFAQKTAEAA